MSWVICLRFSFTRRIRVCVYLIVLVWRGGGVECRLIIILHTSWRPVGAGQTSLLLILPLSTVAQLRAIYPPALPMWKAVITRTSDFSFSLVHGSIALSLSISWQSWWDWSSPLTWAPHSHAFFGAIESSGASQFALVLLQHCVLLYWS